MGALRGPIGAAPAAGFLAHFFGLGFFVAWPDVGRVAERRHHFPHLRVVVARVRAHALPGTAAGGTCRATSAAGGKLANVLSGGFTSCRFAPSGTNPTGMPPDRGKGGD